MNGSAINSSSSTSDYYWKECDPYDDTLGGASVGLIILFATYSSEILLAIPSNIWLICKILRNMSKVSGVLPADFFPFHLALIQLSFCMVLPLSITNHFLWQSETVWMAVTFVNVTIVSMKPLLLCLVCVLRYLAVVRPHDYVRYKAQHYRWICLGVSWGIYFLASSSVFVQHAFIAVCSMFLLVLVIDIFCSVAVLRRLRKPSPGDREMAERDRTSKMRRPRGNGEMNSIKRKAFITIVIIQAVLTFNYLPLIICLPLSGLVPARVYKCQYLAMALAAASSCGYLQPLLYLHKLGRIPNRKSEIT